MSKKQWYETLYANYATQYDKEPFTQGTLGECDFIDSELGGNPNQAILDVGCGTGRHSIELSRRGYALTGIDLSETQLQKARQKAAEAVLHIDFRRCDARHLPFSDAFDAVIMLCEGGFSLMETDAMNYAILEGIARSLKAGGTLIFTALNALFPLFHSVNDFYEAHAGEETSACHSSQFDWMTLRDRNVVEFVDDAGVPFTLDCQQRYYMPSEISWLLSGLGFRSVSFYGAKLGAFSRADALTPNDFEMLVVARK